MTRRAFIKRGALFVPAFGIAKASAQSLINPYRFGSTLNSGLVSYWKLDEASGTRADSVGSASLTDANGIGSGSGLIGNAATFSGTTTPLLSSSSDTLQTGGSSFELAFWVKVTSTTGDAGMVCKGDSLGSVMEYLCYLSAGKPSFMIKTSGAAFPLAQIASAISINTWHFVNAYFDSGINELGIAVDGGSFTTQAAAAPTANTARVFTIGSMSDTSVLLGTIDEVGFWKGRVLTTAERAALYNAGAGKTCCPL
jgi:hypothetical protein